MRVFTNKLLAKFARKNGISDGDLWEAADRANRGLIDADLGGGVIKQRIARRGQGKSGGFRTVILFRAQERAIFVYGFAKKDRDNINAEELQTAKQIASFLLSYSEDEMTGLVASGKYLEVKCDAEEEI